MDVENLQTYLNWFIYLQRCEAYRLEFKGESIRN